MLGLKQAWFLMNKSPIGSRLSSKQILNASYLKYPFKGIIFLISDIKDRKSEGALSCFKKVEKSVLYDIS